MSAPIEELPDPPVDPRSQRKELITKLREARGSDLVITYVTSTRPALEAAMALDAVRCFHDHLPEKPVKQLDLVIHSNGGDGVVPWRLMTLLHEYAEKVDVLVPHRAFSAATLAALGAHQITMHPMGMLGPIDASVNNPLGPTNPASAVCRYSPGAVWNPRGPATPSGSCHPGRLTPARICRYGHRRARPPSM